ncbi:MAG: (2Fe-2S)-binding protein [Candidatus Binatia bacterium]
MSECCASAKRSDLQGTPCPECGAAGREVGRETVGAMARIDVPPARLAHLTYGYCLTPRCRVVYYNRDGGVLQQSDLRVPVNVKDPGPDVPLCYCFGHTRGAIATEITVTGQSSASAVISEEIRAGHCACEVKNPSGRCCLGDVRRYEKQVAEQATAAQSGGAKNA